MSLSLIRKSCESVLYTNSLSSTGWGTCVKAFEQIHGPLKEDRTQASSVSIGGLSLSLLDGDIEPAIWNTLSLGDHKIVPMTPDFQDVLTQAIVYLQTIHGSRIGNRLDFLKAIGQIALRPENHGKGIEATSVSLPALPFASFLSLKALHHIPPGIVSDKPLIPFLAENLYHEATHHWVTIHLLDRDLLVPHYHTQTSPRIDIPWRKDYDDRTRFWEIDRVLHALSVYAAILPYREAEVRLGTELMDQALQKASACTAFLRGALQSHRDQFTDLGLVYLEDLLEKTRFYTTTQKEARKP
jgi:hypothetical protein